MGAVEMLLGKYWPQLSFLLLIIGYFGKRFFDLQTDIRKHRSTIGINRRIESIAQFISVYKKIEKDLIYFDSEELFKRELGSGEYISLLTEPVLLLNHERTFLLLVLNEIDLKPFETISDNIRAFAAFTNRLYHASDDPNTTTEVREKLFFEKKDEIIKANQTCLQVIAASFRKELSLEMNPSGLREWIRKAW